MELKIGQSYDVNVVKILGFGAIVALDDGSTELIHISNISNEYIADISDFIDLDHTYSAMCIQGKTKPAELSLKHLSLVSKRSDVKGARQERKNDNHKYSSGTRSQLRPTHKSLDDMISHTNDVLEDKLGAKPNYKCNTSRPRRRR